MAWPRRPWGPTPQVQANIDGLPGDTAFPDGRKPSESDRAEIVDGIMLLKEDHKMVGKLFKRFEQADDDKARAKNRP